MEAVRFRTDDGVTLEGELREPEGAPRGSAVLCHPHPRQGGTKDHPLLWALRNDLAHRGLAVLSFNFRGVLGSGGGYGGGRTEVRDVAAAVGSVGEGRPGPTIVCGWSFGANVALREALDDDRVAALALIGIGLDPSLDLPPVPGPSELAACRRPVLLLAGEEDRLCPASDLRALAARLPTAEVEIVAGTDHFFWRREREVADLVGAFAGRMLVEG